MPVAETVAIYVGIPAAIMAVLAFFVFVPSATRRSRYRPDAGWTYQPVWYCPHPDAIHADLRALVADPAHPALDPNRVPELESSATAETVDASAAETVDVSTVQPVDVSVAHPADISAARGGAHGDW